MKLAGSSTMMRTLVPVCFFLRKDSQGNLPVSIGISSALAPDALKMFVSTIPGCTLQMKSFGFSTAKYSIIFTCATLELKYPERPAVNLAGKTKAPAVRAYTAAPEGFAFGKKACERTTIDLTFV